MIPAKFKPLTSDSSEESETSNDEQAVTKEALEQQAMSQYQKALDYENVGQWEKAEEILLDLLNSDIIVQSKGKVSGCANIQTSMVHLKYCITLNLGHCLAKQDKLKKSLKYYIKASKLDISDLNLWYCIGKTALKVPDLYLAASAFEEGLRCNPNHWPSIDNLVTVYYALGDYMSSLYYIYKGTTMDLGFLKGYAFKEKIFTQSPTLKEDFSLYYPDCQIPDTPDNICLDSDEVKEMYSNAELLLMGEKEKWAPYEIPVQPPLQPEWPVKLDTWVRLIKCLLYLLQVAESEFPEKNLFRSVKLEVEKGDESPISIEDELSELEDDGNGGSDDSNDENVKGKVNGLYEKLYSSQNQKRRSARVRSTVRREEPSLTESFSNIIPHDLFPKDYGKVIDGWSEDSMHTMDIYRCLGGEDAKPNHVEGVSKKQRLQFIEEEGYFNTQKEFDDVSEFIRYSESSKDSIIDLLKRFLLKISFKWKLYWPEKLDKFFLKTFAIVQRYQPAAMKHHSEPQSLSEDLSILLYGEFLLNRWLEKEKSKGYLSPLGDTALGGSFCSLHLGKLNFRAANSDDMDFFVRSYWLEALLLHHAGDNEAAAVSLQQILGNEETEKMEIKIPNITHHATVNRTIISNLIKSFKRNKSLTEVWELYNAEYYEEVADILADSLKADIDEDKKADETTLSRSMQYSLILDSYCRLVNYKECIIWSEACLNETLTQYRACCDEERPNYANILVKSMQGLLACVESVGYSLFRYLTPEKLTRLVKTLTGIIHYQMEVGDNTGEMPIESVAPWIILHYIMKFDEDSKTKVVRRLDSEEEEDLPPSLRILFMGHDYLGRRSWCCFEEGFLLYHTLKSLYPLLQTLDMESSNYMKITQQTEQIFYCLYGQQKKNRGRHISDHNVLGLALTWARAQQYFKFTKPRELPSYDSTGKCCVTPDAEALFLKLLECVPDSCNPERLLIDMKKYIEQENDEIPKNDNPLPDDVADIYYLLGHYYFKQKTWGKAIKYFLLDVCANPLRLDSWAGLALARGSLIEFKLNSCDTIRNQQGFLKTAAKVCKTYERSLELDPGQSTLWIERGNFSYTIHSFCSNVLKKNSNLSIEMYSTIEHRKDEMIESARQCFISANKLWDSTPPGEIIDERWLHHYMLGKISKKTDGNPNEYMNHYIKSAELLHDVGATYPSNISYSNPQHLAVEALELFYRAHACIIKALEESEEKALPESTLEIFKTIVETLAESPFVLQVKNFPRVEKLKKPKTDALISEDETLSKTILDEQEVTLKAESNQESNSLKRKQSPVEEIQEEPPKKLIIKEDSSSGEKTATRQSVVSTESNETSKVEAPVENPDKAASSSGSVSDANKDSDNSSSSSSSSDSSSSDSSSSSSSSDSDSSSSDSDDDSDSSSGAPEAKKPKIEEPKQDTENWKKQHEWLIEKCLAALELCNKRFPQHYKSFYHLAHFYFKSKRYKNNEKVFELLLGPKGLFAERRATNFFNGVWRIPNNEIDRPGSFAAHMGRCMLLLLDFLKETKDYKMLFDISLQLKITPEADKKYLRDSEREELSKDAAELSVFCLRKKLQESSKDADLKTFVLDVYQMYKRVLKNNMKESSFANILLDAYNKLHKTESKSLDVAQRYCLQELALQKIASTPTTVTLMNSSNFMSNKMSEGINELVPAHTVVRRSGPGRPPLPGRTHPVPGRKPRGRPPLHTYRLPRPETQLPHHQQQLQQQQQQLLQLQQQHQSQTLQQYQLQMQQQSQSQEQSSKTSSPFSNPIELFKHFNLPDQLNIKPASGSSQPSTLKTYSSAPSTTSDLDCAPILKDRPNLSITPVKPANSSLKVSNNSISVSVTKLPNKTQPEPKPVSTPPPQQVQKQASSHKIQPPPPSVSAPAVRSTPPLPPLTVSPVSQNVPKSRSSSPLQKSPVLSQPKSLSISPLPNATTTSIAQPPRKPQLPTSISSSLSITPKSPLISHTFPDTSKPPPFHPQQVTQQLSSPTVSTKSQSSTGQIPASTPHQQMSQISSQLQLASQHNQQINPVTHAHQNKPPEPSLQHKLLSAKKMASANYSKPSSSSDDNSRVLDMSIKHTVEKHPAVTNSFQTSSISSSNTMMSSSCSISSTIQNKISSSISKVSSSVANKISSSVSSKISSSVSSKISSSGSSKISSSGSSKISSPVSNKMSSSSNTNKISSPSAPKSYSNTMSSGKYSSKKDLPNSLTIIPTSSKKETYSKSTPRPSVPDNIDINKIPNLSLTDALKIFNSGLTITATNKETTRYKPELHTIPHGLSQKNPDRAELLPISHGIIQKQPDKAHLHSFSHGFQQKPPDKEVSTKKPPQMNEVIILDDD